MAMVVICHSSGLYLENWSYLINGTLLEPIFSLFQNFGSIGNSLFIVISGFFAGKQAMKTSRLIKVFIPVWTYSSIFFLTYLLFGLPALGSNYVDLITYLLTGHLGFMVGYAFIQITYSQFLVKLLKNTQLTPHTLLIVCIFIATSILAINYYSGIDYSIVPLGFILLNIVNYGIAYSWVFLVGVILFQTPISIPKSILISAVIIGIIISALLNSVNIVNIPLISINWFGTSPLTGITIFVLALHKKPYWNRKINLFGSLMIGVYILHLLFVTRLEQLLMSVNSLTYLYTNHYTLLCLFIVLLVSIFALLASSIIEITRQKIFQLAIYVFKTHSC